MSGGGKVFELRDNQRAAANPRDNVWLSASAGTGKTQVLSARVLRLLLRPDVDPSQILCLTFTKAGAAEMSNRINAVLARWVRLDSGALARELDFLGADIDPETQARARSLFASVIDTPGGGLRIDTIHAFAQFLLANFPGEADLTPGARPMEDRERELLAREVLGELLVSAERQGDNATLGAVEGFVRAKSPEDLRKWLMHCVRHSALWQGSGGWQRPVRSRLSTSLGIPVDAGPDWISEALDPDVFPDHQLAAMLTVLRAWDTKTGRDCSEFLQEWLSLSKQARLGHVDRFFGTVLTKEGAPRKMATPAKNDPMFAARQQEIAEAVAIVCERQALVELVDMLAPALELGHKFVGLWNEAKAREGLLEFDDLIERAAALLANSDAADWIRYKLDRQFDHILIDEAQDTNQQQWDIVFALIDDFFSGDSAAGDKLRTIFTVGDYKQAIFGFQGTSPENFARARDKLHAQIENASTGASELRERRRLPTWQELDLGQSYRTSNVVLQFVNKAIENIGAETFGLNRPPNPHVGEERPGLVVQWKPVRAVEAVEDVEQDGESQEWLPGHERILADKIAEQIWRWHTGKEPFALVKDNPHRQASAGDVMVLVRKRGALAALIVARLHARGVPVAGVDRLRLGAPLAVQDLVAALRFAAQPLDDLNLANLLASPLLGWSQDDLLQFVPRDRGTRLWDHLRKHQSETVSETVEALMQILARADFDTPQALLSWILIGPWQGRKRLVARLGAEANDPIDELVNAAFSYEAIQTPSLAGFIEWIDASDAELKREAGEADGQVQVLTVHGSKGLQRPIVILADATSEPRVGGASELAEDSGSDSSSRMIPLPGLSKEQRVGPISVAEEAQKASDMQEHWRLLYVGMTRAEEGLFIAGALSERQAKKGPHEDSWYARLETVFPTDQLSDDLWGGRLEWGYRAENAQRIEVEDEAAGFALPGWATTPIGPEPRPPKPLAPSSAGEEMGADPPLKPDAAKRAAERGVWIHKLLERLPDIAIEERAERANSWLERQAASLSPEDRAEIADSAVTVLADARFTEVFDRAGLAEVPLAAVVDGQVIAGTVDRLLVESDHVTVVDFKTTRRPPSTLDDVPAATWRQMAAYHSALATIYPGRELRVAVLYTHAPVLIELPAELLEQHKRNLSGTQESYSPEHIE